MSAAPAESPDRPLFDPGDRFWEEPSLTTAVGPRTCQRQR